MRKKLYDYVLARPGGASSAELLNLLFTPGAGSGLKPNRRVEFEARFLHAAIGSDSHFSYDATTDRWSATVHASLQRPIPDAEFVVLDLETTGFKPGPAAITEIAAVRVKHGRLTEEFHALVNPGRRVPPAVTRLTGITDQMLHDQPPIDAVFPLFQTFIGSTPLVAHNADFDLAFLNFDAKRLRASPLQIGRAHV